MPTAEEFDEFYVSTRRELVLQTFALTGDLVASRGAVRDAYVAARHHWEKLAKAPDPMTWVRPRAWARAQRRHTARPWHRERHIDEEQTATLEALHHLKDAQRRTLVLHELTDLPFDAIGREVGQPVARIHELLEEAIETVAGDLDIDSAEIGDRLRDLEPAADQVKLPRPSIVRRNGLRRRRNFAVLGSLAIVGVVVGAGNFVAAGSEPDRAARTSEARVLVRSVQKALLTDEQVKPLSGSQIWSAPTTTENDNSLVSGLNTQCQKDRYADKEGFGALVRTFIPASGKPRKLVETVEISRTDADAEAAYTTTLGWYAGCTVPRVRLASTYTVNGVGDRAQVLLLRGTRKTDSSFLVGLARSGKLTVSTALEAQVSTEAKVADLVRALSTAVTNLCTSKAAGTCVGTVAPVISHAATTGEAPGMLKAVDLPLIDQAKVAWGGTDPEPAKATDSSTICDKADFTRSGAANPISRSFVFPSGAPENFGVSETVGRFASPKAAAKFVNGVIGKMRSCSDRVLSSTVTKQVVQQGTATKPSFAYWRVTDQLENRDEVVYLMGITRVGPYVAQVKLTPIRKFTVDDGAFSQLLLRGRDRLFEVS